MEKAREGSGEGGKWRYISPITGRIYGIPFMLSFRERSQVTIPGLRRSRNEISFASPRGARFRTSASRSLPAQARRLSSNFPTTPGWRTVLERPPPPVSSNFLFVSRRPAGGASPGSLPEGSRRGTILFLAAHSASSLPLTVGGTLCKRTFARHRF